MRRNAVARCIAVLGSGLVPATPAAAQQGPVLSGMPRQTESRHVAVLERVQPGYSVSGVPVGGLDLFPSVNVETVYDDNVFAQETGRIADAFLRIEPVLTATRQSREAVIRLEARGTIDRYLERTTENVTDYAFTAAGDLQIDRATTLSAGVRAENDHQPRFAQDIFAQTVRPLEYDLQSAEARLLHDFTRLRLVGTVRAIRLDFQDGQQIDGTVYDQRSASNVSTQLTVRASYLQTPAFAWFVSGSTTKRDFKTGTAITPERDSQEYQVLAGATFDPEALVRGTIGIGYVRRQFRLPFYRSIGGLALNANVLFFPSQLTTVTLRASRAVLDAGIPRSGGYLSTEGGAQVDHEFLRQLIISLSTSYQHNTFNTIDRTDDRLGAGIGATYRANRYADIRLQYDRIDQASEGADRYRAFTDNRLVLGLRLKR